MTRHYQRAIISELHDLGVSFPVAVSALQSSGALRSTIVTAIYRWEQRTGRAFPRPSRRGPPSALRNLSSLNSRDPLIRQIFTVIAQRGISLEQLVSGTGLSRRTIWDIRSGKAKDPGIGKVRRLAKVAGLAWPERLAGVDMARGDAYVTGRGRAADRTGITLPAHGAPAPYPLHSPARRSPSP
jgi:transcriptional regulator with XRE-family HTH domain